MVVQRETGDDMGTKQRTGFDIQYGMYTTIEQFKEKHTMLHGETKNINCMPT